MGRRSSGNRPLVGFRLNLPGGIFLAVGVLLLGLAAWLGLALHEALQWPRVEATVESSRVVEPAGSGYRGEIVVRYRVGGREETRTLDPGFSTSSHDWMKSYVDRFPPGSVHRLPLNPEDPSDLRLETGWTGEGVLGPAILAFSGMVFGFIGWVACLEGLWDRLFRQRRIAALGPVVFAGSFGLVGTVVLLVGLGIGWNTMRVLQTWPEVTGTVVDSRRVKVRTAAWTAAITFRYEWKGREYQAETGPGWTTSSPDMVENTLRSYAPGSTHPLRLMPQDPNIMRYGMGYNFSTFFLPGVLVLGGAVFLGLAAVGYRLMGKA